MHVWPLRYLPDSGLCKARELLDRYILFATQDSGMITDVNMERFLVFLIVHDDSSADHEGEIYLDFIHWQRANMPNFMPQYIGNRAHVIICDLLSFSQS